MTSLWGKTPAIEHMITVGVDIGQRSDHTAIAVVEQELRSRMPFNPEPEVHHVCRLLERLPLGTSYVDVGRRVYGIVESLLGLYQTAPAIYVDATGVGTAVIEIIQRQGVRAHLYPVFFTYGDRRLERATMPRPGDHRPPQSRPLEIRLGKAHMVGRLQALFHAKLLHLSTAFPDAQAMEDELLHYEIKISDRGTDTYGAFQVGAHDDLITALGLATQTDSIGGHWQAEGGSHTRGEPITPGAF